MTVLTAKMMISLSGAGSMITKETVLVLKTAFQWSVPVNRIHSQNNNSRYMYYL